MFLLIIHNFSAILIRLDGLILMAFENFFAFSWSLSIFFTIEKKKNTIFKHNLRRVLVCVFQLPVVAKKGLAMGSVPTMGEGKIRTWLRLGILVRWGGPKVKGRVKALNAGVMAHYGPPSPSKFIQCELSQIFKIVNNNNNKKPSVCCVGTLADSVCQSLGWLS